MSVRSVHVRKDILHSVLPHTSKEVTFHVNVKLSFDVFQSNDFLKHLFSNLVRYLIKYLYVNQNSGKSANIIAKHGDYIRLILTGDRFIDKPKKNSDPRSMSNPIEQIDLNPTVDELESFNLLTLSGEHDYSDSAVDDPDNSKSSDLLDEHGEIYTDTLWSPRD